MNMHPGDRRSIEENEEADSAKKEETSPIGHTRLSEMTKTPIHIEAEVGFLVVLFIISRFRWVSFICAFGAVYAAAFWVFVGLISAAFIIGRGFYKKGAKSTWTRLACPLNGHAQYPSITHKSVSRVRSLIELILGNRLDAFKCIWSTDVLTAWFRPSSGIKRGHVPDPRPTESRFPVQMELVEELSKISFDRSYGAEHYTPMLAYILGYPKLESWSAKHKHYWQTFTTGCLLSKTNGSSVRSKVERAKV